MWRHMTNMTTYYDIGDIWWHETQVQTLRWSHKKFEVNPTTHYGEKRKKRSATYVANVAIWCHGTQVRSLRYSHKKFEVNLTTDYGEKGKKTIGDICRQCRHVMRWNTSTNPKILTQKIWSESDHPLRRKRKKNGRRHMSPMSPYDDIKHKYGP